MKKIFYVLICLLMISNLNQTSNARTVQNQADALNHHYPMKSKPILAYTNSSEIIINKNTDFISLAFPGSGTRQNPYKIDGLNISLPNIDLIKISDTDAYFIIGNNNRNDKMNNI